MKKNIRTELRSLKIKALNLKSTLQEGNSNIISLQTRLKLKCYPKCQGANLEGANLFRAYLRDVQLYGANLTDASLEGADLTGVNLFRAKLIRADLRGARLENAKLFGADITDADLRGAIGVNFFCTKGIPKYKINDPL